MSNHSSISGSSITRRTHGAMEVCANFIAYLPDSQQPIMVDLSKTSDNVAYLPTNPQMDYRVANHLGTEVVTSEHLGSIDFVTQIS